MAAAAATGPELDRGNPQGALLSGGLIVLGAFLVMSAGVSSGISGAKMAMLGLALFTACLGLFVIALDQSRAPNQRHILLDLFALTYVILFTIPVLTNYVWTTGLFDPPDMPFSQMSIEQLLPAQLAVLFGFIVLLGGYASPLGRAASLPLPPPRYEWTQAAALGAGFVWISLGWALHLLSLMGLLPPRLGSGVLGGISNATLIGPGLLTIIYVKHRNQLARLALWSLVLVGSVLGFFTGSKTRVLTPLIMVALTWMIATGRLRARWMAVGLAALVVLYPAAEFYRNVVRGGGTRVRVADIMANPAAAISQISAFVSGSDTQHYLLDGIAASTARLDGLGRMAVIVRDVPERVPYQGGWTIGRVAVSYVPRVIWPEKPHMGIGQFITDNFGAGAHIKTATGPTVPGEFYLNFGFAGVIGGMFMLGVLLRFLHEQLFGRVKTTLSLLCGVIVVYYILRAFDGSLVALVNGPVLTILPLLGAHVVIRMMGGAYPIDPDTGEPLPGRKRLPGIAPPSGPAEEAQQPSLTPS